MRKPLIIIVVVMFVALSFTWLLFRNQLLRTTQKFVESNYAEQIQLIETAMKGLKLKNDEVDSLELRKQSQQLSKHFQMPEIFHVEWSSDGHHTLNSIVPLPTSFTQHPYKIPYGASDSDHKLLTGSSTNGDELIIYQGWVRDAEVMRQYQIVFYAKKLRQIMAQQQ